MSDPPSTSTSNTDKPSSAEGKATAMDVDAKESLPPPPASAAVVEKEEPTEKQQEGEKKNAASSRNNDAVFVPTMLSPSSMFPAKLHQLITDAEREGNTDIVSWMPDGKSFKVHNRERFEQELMPRYFGSSKYRSFQKNLNLWGYDTALTHSKSHPLRGETSNPNFLRDFPEKCLEMKRVVKNKALKKQQQLQDQEEHQLKQKQQQQQPTAGVTAPSKLPASTVAPMTILPSALGTM